MHTMQKFYNKFHTPKDTLIHCWWECYLFQPPWKMIWKVLSKLRIELPSDPAIPLLSIYPQDLKIIIQKDVCTPLFIAILSAVAKTWDQPRGPTTVEWVGRYGPSTQWDTMQLQGIINHTIC